MPSEDTQAVKDVTAVARELFQELREGTGTVKELSPEELYSIKLGSGEELHANKTFAEMKLKEKLLESLYAQGFEKPSIIQCLAVPRILAKRNVVFQSRSGTGKTVAFALGALNTVEAGKGPQALILTPTRELCIQVSGVLRTLAKPLDLRVCAALSDFEATSISDEIVVACPGKTITLAQRGILDANGIKMVVLDEADELISNRTLNAQTLRILKAFSGAQRVLFSATYSETSQSAVQRLINDCDTFFEKNTAAAKIRFYHVSVSAGEKMGALKDLLSYLTVAQTIIFCNRRADVDRIAAALEKDQFSVSRIHAGLEKSERDEAFGRFLTAKTKVLVATDVFSRGMDIPQVNLIVNYELPDERDSDVLNRYIHRVGRSGRFNRPGFVVDLVGGEEEDRMARIHTDARLVSSRFTFDALKTAFAEADTTE